MIVKRILGIDPGSRLTGFGVVDLVGNQLRVVEHGTLRLSNTGGRAVIPLDQRLLLIHQGLSEVIARTKPTILAVERVFFAKNAVSALKLGQARGAVVLSGAIHGLEIVDYSPSEIKAAICGNGQAGKDQIARMVEILLGIRGFATSDASDALAIAITHAQILATRINRGGRYQAALDDTRAAVAQTKRSKKKSRSIADSIGVERFVKTPKGR